MTYNPTQDPFATHASSSHGTARKAVAITPSDSTDLAPYVTALYVGGSGALRIIPVGNDDSGAVTLANHPEGYAPIQVRRVLATGTTATNIVGLIG